MDGRDQGSEVRAQRLNSLPANEIPIEPFLVVDVRAM